MSDPDAGLTRTLTIVLPEREWQALREAEPDAIGWLQDRIRERLSTPPPAGEQSGPTKEQYWFRRDEY